MDIGLWPIVPASGILRRNLHYCCRTSVLDKIQTFKQENKLTKPGAFLFVGKVQFNILEKSNGFIDIRIKDAIGFYEFNPFPVLPDEGFEIGR